ncbi:Protein suppressor of white apricot [Schistosoma japonicum]|nr:Protein suppressor of white apricot [Schistosoma japonicum]
MNNFDEEKQFLVEGKSCTLFCDPEKAIEVNGDELLIPWCGDKSILIDRSGFLFDSIATFDGRGYLTDVYEQDINYNLNPDDYMSEEEIAIEKMCDFERYLEMQVDVHELAIQDALSRRLYGKRLFLTTSSYVQTNLLMFSIPIYIMHSVFCSTEEARKREAEQTRNNYGAVSFCYEDNTSNEDESNVNTAPAESDNDMQHVEEQYNCPPELQQFLQNFQLPESDKQAHIIEKTAVFVARQGSQMEIVLKAKQHNNPLFGFLTYDHPLNPFYKEIVRLISIGRYVPKPRQTMDKPAGTLFTNTNESNMSIHDDVYELKLPKVDISNTPYAPLISKFRKINEMAAAVAAASRAAAASDAQSPVTTSETPKETEHPIEVDGNSTKHLTDNNMPSDLIETTTLSPQPPLNDEQRGIINKMAEYVVRNGLEFEELVIRQKTKDPRFAFLKSDHPLHSYYMARRKELDPDDSLTKAADSNFINIPYPKSPKIRSSKKLDSVDKPEAVFPDNKSKNDPLKKPQSLDSDKAKKVDLETHNSERQKSISFRLSRPIPPKSQSTQNTEAPTEEIMDIIEAAAQEYSESISKSSRRSDEQRTESKIHSKGDIHRKSQKRKSRSPNMNIIPGIPSPSSSSSFESSPLQGESPYSYTHRCSDASNSNSVCTSPSNSVERHRKNELVNYIRSPVHHVRSITSPFDNDLSSVESTSNLNAHLTPNWPLCALEDLLDIHEPTSLLDFSADGYQVAMPTAKEERLREERRKKAAQLVTQLKLTNSIAKANVNTCSATSKPSTVTISSSTADRYRSSPPPAPDSVPAAVAHAVVANMKRRREALEIENKARRKRHRSPPAAYALTRNRMFDRSPRRSPTPKCDRESLRDWDDHHFKSKKKHHKKSCY